MDINEKKDEVALSQAAVVVVVRAGEADAEDANSPSSELLVADSPASELSDAESWGEDDDCFQLVRTLAKIQDAQPPTEHLFVAMLGLDKQEQRAWAAAEGKYAAIAFAEQDSLNSSPVAQVSSYGSSSSETAMTVNYFPPTPPTTPASPSPNNISDIVLFSESTELQFAMDGDPQYEGDTMSI